MEILQIVISAIVGGTVVFITNNITSNLNYKRDYYKKVIDKRMSAYEKMQSLLAKLNQIYWIDENTFGLSICSSMDEFDKVKIQLIEVFDLSLWLSTDMEIALFNLNTFIVANIYTKIPPVNKPENHLQELGINHLSEIRAMCHKANEILIRDITTLHVVKSFFDDAQSQSQKQFELSELLKPNSQK